MKKRTLIERLVETRIHAPNGLIIVRPYEDRQGGRGVELDFEAEEGGRCYPSLMIDPLLDYYAKNNAPYMVKAILAATGRQVQ